MSCTIQLLFVASFIDRDVINRRAVVNFDRDCMTVTTNVVVMVTVLQFSTIRHRNEATTPTLDISPTFLLPHVFYCCPYMYTTLCVTPVHTGSATSSDSHNIQYIKSIHKSIRDQNLGTA